MASPKRYNIKGHIHFVTTTCYKRVPLFLYDTCNTFVVETLKFYRGKYGFGFIGYTIMPDHLHLLIQLSHTTKISDVVRDIKHAVAFKILSALKAGQQAPPYPGTQSKKYKAEPLTLPKGRAELLMTPNADSLSLGRAGLLALPLNNNLLARLRLENPGKRGHRHSVWERRFYDFNIYTQETLKEKLNYIHMNPVRKGLVGNPGDWRYSSFRNYSLGDDSVITIDKIGL